MSQVYGGDEVNAIVLDTGGCWTRLGWAGEDSPNYVISSTYAERDGTRLFGDEHTFFPRPNTVLRNPIEDSVVTDWDATVDLWKYGFAQASINLKESPVLVTESLWNTDANRKKTLEVMLEELESPATYIAKTAACSLFACGRGSGLVVDCGHQTMSATAVVDGLVLNRPSTRSRKAGLFLNRQVAGLLGDVVPSFEIASKQATEPDQEPVFTKRDLTVDESFYKFQQDRVYEDFKENMVQVTDAPLSDEFTATTREYELPNGHILKYGKERYELGESMFKSQEKPEDTAMEVDEEAKPADDKPQEKPQEAPPLFKPWSTEGASQLVIEAINSCDVDLRASLVNNIVFTGGSSLLQGFTERIHQDIVRAFPALKVRIWASGNFNERRYASWIGGSIVASLGTFHQLWVSRQEYEEVGADQLIEKRFR